MALIWAVANQLGRRIPGQGWAVPALTVALVIGWIGWMASRRLDASGQITWGFLALLAASGGVLVAFSGGSGRLSGAGWARRCGQRS